ncbi:hypothetical protein [Promicromonospora sukumoe]
MNQHDGRDQDHGWVDPAGTDLLAQTLGAMAGGVDPASPTGPAAATAAMGRRVRRRRGAKLGGLGGGALALAAAVALGAGQLAPPDQAEVLPGASTPVQAFQVRDGYQPSWLEWSDLTCGMPVNDLETTAEGWSVAAAGDIYARTTDLGGAPSRSWGMASSLQDGQGELDVAPVLVWSRDGEVVDLGQNVFEAEGSQSEPLIGAGEDVVAATGGSVSTCSPTSTDLDPVYETPLPEGDYEVRVVAFPQVASGRRAVAVGERVLVNVSADAHRSLSVNMGVIRDDPTIELPEPVKGQVTRFELDRPGDWLQAEMTQSGYSSEVPMRVMGQCEDPGPETTLPIELVLPSTGKVVGAAQITCDGDEAGTEIGVLDGGGEVVDIRLPSVPDGVSRLWVSLEPATPQGDGSGPECSTTGYEPRFDLDNFPIGDIAAAAGAIVIAAMDCDSDALIALAEDSGTELMSGTGTPEQVFALPETDTEHYRTLASLLSDTRGEIVGDVVSGDVTGAETVVWPRVATEEFRDSEGAWDEVVAAGLLTAEEAEAQRVHGYQGPRIAIGTDMTWQSYTAGE